MIKEVIEGWNKNKDKLEEYLKNTPQEKYSTYDELVKLVVKYTFKGFDEDDEDIDIRRISFGHYQGIDIYLISKSCYPDLEDIIYTHNYYGSCCGCDTLQRIQFDSNNCGEGKPTKSQLKDYMSLCLHLVENMKYLKGEE